MAGTTTILRVKRRRDEAAVLPEHLLMSLPDAVPGHHGGGAGGAGGAAPSPRTKRYRRSAADRRTDAALAGLMDRSARVVEGEDDGGDDNSGGDDAVGPRPAQPGGARFRRMLEGELPDLGGGGGPGGAGGKRVRVVDARVVAGDEEGLSRAGGGVIGVARKAKRARLALDLVAARDVDGGQCWPEDLLGGAGVEFWKQAGDTAVVAAAGRKRRGGGGLPVLDPAARRVDASLRRAFRHELTGVQHLAFLRLDPTLLAMVQHDLRSDRWLSWLNHSCLPSGTVLHVAALANDVESAGSALQLGADLAAVDGDGHTPLALAKAVGSGGVAALLAQHTKVYGSGDDDDGNYVYDVYCLSSSQDRGNWEEDRWDSTEKWQRANARADREGEEENAAMAAGAQRAGDGSEEKKDVDEEYECRVEIKGGVGYWNDAGDLVLEADERDGEGLGDDDASFGDDDDHDSNDEGYEGNDYPEEEQSQSNEERNVRDSSDDEDHALYGRSYRADPVGTSAARYWSNAWNDPNGDDDTSYDGGACMSGFQEDDPYMGGGSNDYQGEMIASYRGNRSNGEGDAYAFDPDLDCEE
jgi:hypothetical protein